MVFKHLSSLHIEKHTVGFLLWKKLKCFRTQAHTWNWLLPHTLRIHFTFNWKTSQECALICKFRSVFVWCDGFSARQIPIMRETSSEVLHSHVFFFFFSFDVKLRGFLLKCVTCERVCVCVFVVFVWIFVLLWHYTNTVVRNVWLLWF